MSYQENSATMQEPTISNFDEAQLMSLQQKIRSNILNLIRQKRFGKELQEKKSLYNQVTGVLSEQQLGPHVDPMEKLPYEIVSKILLEIGRYMSRYITPSLLLTMVSKKWRDFVFADSRLWTNLRLINAYDKAAVIALQVHLSRDLPLMLEVIFPFERWDSLLPALFGSQERIHTIVCTGYDFYLPSDGHRRDTEFINFLNKLGPLPNLRKLENLYTPIGMSFDIQKLLDSYQTLESITNIPFTRQDLQVAKDRLKIETLLTFDGVDDIMPVAETIPTLQKVEFGRKGIIGDTEVEQSQYKWHPARRFSWTELKWNTSLRHFPLPLLHFPSLTQLNIKIGVKALNDLTSAIHQLRVLEDVRIEVEVYENIILPVMSTTPPNPNVRVLNIYINGYISGTLDPTARGPQWKVNPDIELLTTSILLLMPSTDELSISIAIGGSSVPIFPLEGLFHGTDLTLYFGYDGVEDPKPTLIPPSTCSLVLTCDEDAACSLSSRSLKSLSIRNMYSRGGLYSRSAGSKLDLNCWPALEKLFIDGNAVEWSKFSLDFLKLVNIHTDRGSSQGNTGITFFIRDIASHPDSYPSLEEIELTECPELDILMIMLERRNLLQGPGIKKIKRISFSSACSFSIQKIISKLLAGKWAERPSNKDLSLAGNAEVLLDLTLPGCYMCHRGLRFCDDPVQDIPKGGNTHGLLEALQVYPEDEDEILSSWRDRAVLWEDIDRNRAGRVMSCSWSESTWENITADSL
ncbi:hypothetical protein CPB86DRAFT_790381 [Serendipita vermifera]|nr:hypothetical protein CPB86DRAFT_790381 [Serendipita vermifera]